MRRAITIEGERNSPIGSLPRLPVVGWRLGSLFTLAGMEPERAERWRSRVGTLTDRPGPGGWRKVEWAPEAHWRAVYLITDGQTVFCQGFPADSSSSGFYLYELMRRNTGREWREMHGTIGIDRMLACMLYAP